MLASSSDSSEAGEAQEKDEEYRIAERTEATSWLSWFTNGCASWIPATSALRAHGAIDDDGAEIKAQEERMRQIRPEIADALIVVDTLPESLTLQAQKPLDQDAVAPLSSTFGLVVVGDIDAETPVTAQEPSRSPVIFRALEIIPWRPSPDHRLKNKEPPLACRLQVSLLNDLVDESVVESVVVSVLAVTLPLLNDRDRLTWCFRWCLTALLHSECTYKSLRSCLRQTIYAEGIVSDPQNKARDASARTVLAGRSEFKSLVVLKSITLRHITEVTGEWEALLETTEAANTTRFVIILSAPVAVAIYLSSRRTCSVFDTGFIVENSPKVPQYRRNGAPVTARWATTSAMRDSSVTAFSSPQHIMPYVFNLFNTASAATPGSSQRVLYTLLTTRGLAREENSQDLLSVAPPVTSGEDLQERTNVDTMRLLKGKLTEIVEGGL